jgi:4-methyl-5(b-hydroxyethyl)-thiazole monophosphate biosynthesis
MSFKTVLLLAPGYEELEAVAIVDILRRAAIDVLVAGTVAGPVASARDVKIIPDVELEEIKDELFDLVILPGGIDGTENLSGDARVVAMLERQVANNKGIGAICAAPTLFDRHGISKGRTITCHPICRSDVRSSELSDQRVVMDGNIITSQGPGTAIEFALKLVEFLAGKEKMLEVNKGVLAKI